MTKFNLPRRPTRVDLNEIIPIDVSGTDSEPNSEIDDNVELHRPDYVDQSGDEDGESVEEFIEFLEEEVAAYGLPEPREDVEVGDTGLSEVDLIEIHEASTDVLLEMARSQSKHEEVIQKLMEKTAFTDGTLRDIGTAFGDTHQAVQNVKETKLQRAKAWVTGSLKLYAAHHGNLGPQEGISVIPNELDFTADDADAIFDKFKDIQEGGDNPIVDAADTDITNVEMGNAESEFAEELAEYETELRKEDANATSSADDSDTDSPGPKPEPQGGSEEDAD